MTSSDDFDLSALWQEQAGPPPKTEIRALAEEVKAKARRVRFIEIAFGVAVMILIVGVLASPTTRPLRLGLLISFPVLVWLLWRRWRIAAATLKLNAGDPGSFLAGAVKSARAELRLSSANLWLGTPIYLLWFVLVVTAPSKWHLDIAPGVSIGSQYVGAAIFLLTLLASYVFFIRINRRLRARLLRLQAMAAEYDEEAIRDRAQDA